MKYLNLFLSAFLSDMLIKKYAEAKLPMGKKISVFGDRIWIRKLHNVGAAGGIMAGRPDILLKGTFGLLGAVFGYAVLSLRGSGKGLAKAGVSLLLAGGFCNWFDRLHQGFVTDYFSFNSRQEKIRNLVFNFSDLYIFIGSILVVLGSVLTKKKK